MLGAQEHGQELPTPNPGRKNIPKACPTRNPATSPARPAEGLWADPTLPGEMGARGP